MEKPRFSTTIERELADVKELTRQVEHFRERFPEDGYLRLCLDEMAYRHGRLLAELLVSQLFYDEEEAHKKYPTQ